MNVELSSCTAIVAARGLPRKSSCGPRSNLSLRPLN